MGWVSGGGEEWVVRLGLPVFAFRDWGGVGWGGVGWAVRVAHSCFLGFGVRAWGYAYLFLVLGWGVCVGGWGSAVGVWGRR